MSVYDETDLAYRDDAREDACLRATGHSRRVGVHESWRGRVLQCLDCDKVLGPAPKAWPPLRSAKNRRFPVGRSRA